MKRKGSLRQQSSSFAKKSSTVEKIPDENVDQNDESFFYDEIDQFHSEKDKLLFENEDVQSDDDLQSEEEEVLGIESDVVESDDEIDSEVDPDDGMPSNFAWGKKKSTFYGADSLEGLEGSDKEEAELEEEREVLAMQERLTRQIDEEDIGLELLQTAGQMKGTQKAPKSHVQADFSKLSVKAQWKLVKKESPELPELIKDFKEKLSVIQEKLSPLMTMVESKEIIKEDLTLRANKTMVENHPVIERLVQYRRIINQLTPIDDKLEPQLEELCAGFSRSGDESTSNERKDDNKRLKKSSTLKAKAKSSEDEKIAAEFYKSMSEKLLLNNNNADELEQMSETKNLEEEERRAINYEMEKNKGLTQKRRKIDRNPRVKLRHKYKKAKISRRGQVREYKPEIKKYSGEASGIRIGLRKSITLQ